MWLPDMDELRTAISRQKTVAERRVKGLDLVEKVIWLTKETSLQRFINGIITETLKTGAFINIEACGVNLGK